jgi:hypothetical protein
MRKQTATITTTDTASSVYSNANVLPKNPVLGLGVKVGSEVGSNVGVKVGEAVGLGDGVAEGEGSIDCEEESEEEATVKNMLSEKLLTIGL